VKAVVPGAVDGEPRSVTVLVAIENGKLAGRQRATADDGCATETYEKVNLLGYTTNAFGSPGKYSERAFSAISALHRSITD
jgi:hypothetical protein